MPFVKPVYVIGRQQEQKHNTVLTKYKLNFKVKLKTS